MPTENSYEEDDFEGTTERDAKKQDSVRNSLNLQPSKKHIASKTSPEKDLTAPEEDDYEEDR